MSGARAGAVVLIGVGVTNLANYVFYLLTARTLGPSPYSDVATLTAISSIITLPLAGIQTFVARHVARAGAEGHSLNEDNYVSGVGGMLVVVGGALTLVLAAFTPLLQSTLSIASLTALVLTVLVTFPSFLSTVLAGALQGSQRFVLLTVTTAFPSVARLILAEIALQTGLGVAGVMGALLLAVLLALVIPFIALRTMFGDARRWRPSLPRRDLAALLPVVAGVLAVTCLSTDDLVAAKIAFGSHEAGLYSSASLVGRVILYLPAAVITVLLPKVAARVSAAHRTVPLFMQSIGATALFCIVASALYAAVPHFIIRLAFGSKYEGAASLLWMFGIAMTLFSLLNVLLAYRVGHGETRTCWLLLIGGVVQALGFAAFHATPHQLLEVSITVGAVLMAIAVAGPSRYSPVSVRRWLHTA
jgi:O-antigen/teichoic acid export membrane protein